MRGVRPSGLRGVRKEVRSHLHRADFGGDVATCTSREESLCAKDIAAPGATSEGSDLAACTPLFANMACDAFVSGLFKCKLSPGALAKGTACGVNEQCATGYCNLAAGTKCGVCDDSVPAGGFLRE